MYNYSELLSMMIDNNERELAMYEQGDPATAAMVKDLLRICHDYNNPKYEAAYVIERVQSRIAEYVVDTSSCTPIIYPEDEGAGYTDWDEVDAKQAEAPAGLTYSTVEAEGPTTPADD
ncbi:MAG: hypothetical protein ACOH1M_04025 [Rhodoglobus sp.]